MTRSRCLATVTTLSALLVGALASTALLAVPTAGGDRPELAPLPMPDLSTIDAAARDELVRMRETVDQLEAKPGTPVGDRAEAWGQLGRLFHAYELYGSAEVAYGNSRELRSTDPRWPYYQGLVRQSQGDLEGAASAWRRALELDPDDTPSRLRLGGVLLELGQVAEARGLYEAVLAEDGESAAATWGLGRAALEEGAADDAVRWLEKTLELQPDATAVHYTLGQAYRRAGDMAAAREHLMQRGEGEVAFADPLGLQVERLSKGTAFQIVLAMASSEDELTDEELLGFALGQFGDVRGTIEELRRGIARRLQEGDVPPNELARIRFVLGGLLVNDDRDEEAVKEFQEALRLDPGHHESWVKLGNAWARAGRFDEALSAFDQVLQASPERTDVRIKRAAARMESGDCPGAIEDLERIVSQVPDQVEAHVRWAGCLAQLGQLPEAQARYGRALEQEPMPREEAGVRVGLAAVLEARGDSAGALAELQRAVAVDPGHIPARLALGARFAREGRWPEAAEQYGAIVDGRPSHVQARLAHAASLIYAGCHREARETLERGLRAVPDDLRILDVLARHLGAAPDRAVRDGARAIELSTKLREAWPTVQSAETLAMAYAEAGRFEDAIRWQQTALEEAAGDAGTQARLRQHLDLYRRSIPCCGE